MTLDWFFFFSKIYCMFNNNIPYKGVFNFCLVLLCEIPSVYNFSLF